MEEFLHQQPYSPVGYPDLVNRLSATNTLIQGFSSKYLSFTEKSCPTFLTIRLGSKQQAHLIDLRSFILGGQDLPQTRESPKDSPMSSPQLAPIEADKPVHLSRNSMLQDEKKRLALEEKRNLETTSSCGMLVTGQVVVIVDVHRKDGLLSGFVKDKQAFDTPWLPWLSAVLQLTDWANNFDLCKISSFTLKELLYQFSSKKLDLSPWRHH